MVCRPLLCGVGAVALRAGFLHRYYPWSLGAGFPGLALAPGGLKYPLWIFGLSALFTGSAGAFHAAHFGVVGPTAFSFSMLMFVLAMNVLGGLVSTWGPLIGVAVLMWADEGLREVGDWREIGIGLVLAACVILLPRGLAALSRPRRGEAGPGD